VATILLVEDVLDIGAYEASLLEAAGHTVIICRGTPVPFGACPLMRDGACTVADRADLLLFSAGLFAPVGGQPFRGLDLLRRYRRHPAYGRLPCVVVALGTPGDLPGDGPVRVVGKFSPPRRVVAAVEELLAERVPVLSGAGPRRATTMGPTER
jgi:CheY-like chemotaxis protein